MVRAAEALSATQLWGVQVTGVVVEAVPTLTEAVSNQLKQLTAYRECINKIDDYLEHKRESQTDAIHILAMLDRLAGDLRGIGG